MSSWSQHVANWKGCTRCPLHLTRKNVVLARGKLPCEVLFLGEAPGTCISGDTLIDTAFRNKSIYPDGLPIRNLVGLSKFQVYSYDIATRKLVLGTVKRVWETGLKQLYRVSYFWWGGKPDGSGGRHRYTGSIEVTDNHPILLKNGSYKSLTSGLGVGDRLQPFYRRQSGSYGYVGASSKELEKESRFLIEAITGEQLPREIEVHHRDRNKLNDNRLNLQVLSQVEHARLHGFEDNAMYNEVHRETHRRVMNSEEYKAKQSEHMRGILADPDNYRKRCAQIQSQREQTSATVRTKFATDPVYYYRYLKGRRFGKSKRTWSDDEIREKMLAKFPEVEYPPEENHKVYRIEKMEIAPVYDMEVDKYHNFAANGIFVHNSEDVLGSPFVGPAGQLLDKIIAKALADALLVKPAGSIRIAFTNVVACMPLKVGSDHRPPQVAIDACHPRLVEFVSQCAQPKVIVLVGDVARKEIVGQADFGDCDWLGHDEFICFAEVKHPAAILRTDVSTRAMECQLQAAKIAEVLEELR